MAKKKLRHDYEFVGPPNAQPYIEGGFAPGFASFLSALGDESAAQGMPMKVVPQTGGLRTPEEQMDIFLQEDSPNRTPSKTIYGRHTVGQAADVRPKKYSQRNEFWSMKDRIARDFGMGLVRGDRPHVESPNTKQAVRKHMKSWMDKQDPYLVSKIADRYDHLGDKFDKAYMHREAKKLREEAFQRWWKTNPAVVNWREKMKAKFGSEPSQDVPEYDYRAAFRAGVEPEEVPQDDVPHWSSEFKSDDHPNRFEKQPDGTTLDTKTGNTVAPEQDGVAYQTLNHIVGQKQKTSAEAQALAQGAEVVRSHAVNMGAHEAAVERHPSHPSASAGPEDYDPRQGTAYAVLQALSAPKGGTVV